MRRVLFLLLLIVWSSTAYLVLTSDSEEEAPKSRQAQRARSERIIKPSLFWGDKS